MAVGVTQRELEALAAAGVALGSATNLAEALELVADGVAHAVRADVVIARVVDETRGGASAVAVVSSSAALGAELSGSRIADDELPEHEEAELERLPGPVRRAAERARAAAVVVLPVHVDGRVRGTLELLRA